MSDLMFKYFSISSNINDLSIFIKKKFINLCFLFDLFTILCIFVSDFEMQKQ